MKKVTPKLVIVFICLIVLLVGYYAYLANQKKEAKQEAAMTVVQATLSRDLKYDYPSTPKEVIKFYNEILRCFYNEKCTDGEIEELGQKARELYDEELLEANEYGPYMIKLKSDIEDYKNNKRRITSFAVAANTNVDFFEEDGYSFARISCAYNIMEGEVSKPTRQVYLLRKDADNHWKIYGWEDAVNLEEDQSDETAE